MNFTATSYDKLTGLPDRSSFQNCALELTQGSLLGLEPSLIFFNIENFKLFNSTLGTEAGDGMLIFTANVIQNAFQNDLVARIGEDHFAVLTCEMNLGEKITAIHNQVKKYHPGLVMLLKAGIYEIQDYDTHPILMLDRARLACASCKGHFDQIYDYYNPDLSESLLTNKYIVDHIDKAIEQEYIKVYYQPLIRVYTGKLCGVEALSRWQDPKYGLLSPAAFISVLEHAHLIHRLDLYVASKVCRDLRALLDEGKTVVPVSINLSRLDFELCDVFETIDEMVKSNGLTSNLIDIEITESALSKGGDSLRKAARRFRESGYRIWIDDFGSDYSSLNVLKDFDFDVLKIDMAFLSGFSDASRSEKTKTIVRSVINMAKELGITTLCEGVETTEELSFLSSSGCEIAQGYYFSRPVPLEELLKLPLEMENREDARFSEIVGKVNLLSAHPLGETDRDDLDAGFLPMALFEFSKDHIRTLVFNTAFREFIATLNVTDNSQLDVYLNMRNNHLVERMVRAAERTVETHKAENVDIVLDGDYCSLQMLEIAANENTSTSVIFVKAANVSKTSNFIAGGIKDKVLRSVYALFERVDILDIENDRLLNVYKSRDRFRGSYDDMTLQQAVAEFARLNIHPDDQERFQDVYNVEKLVEKLQASHHSFHSSIFRIHEGDGIYSWQLCFQSLVRLDGRTVILSLVCDGEESTETIGQALYKTDHISNEKTPVIYGDPADSAISKSLLFDSLIQSVPLGIFWKDKNRRFLGANSFFLDFYGFPSSASIIGNTDEDMGWHVDPVPFMKDENDVLNGKAIYDAAGSCIVHGLDHKISASKFPVYKNGSVIGLIGMFKDLGVNIEDTAEGIDPLTGLLNAQGAIETFTRYEKSYSEKNIDFLIISIDINDFREFNHLYGSLMADELLVKIASVLASALGDNSVVSRIGGDEFVILRQVFSSHMHSHDEYTVASAVASIHSIHGIDVSVSVTTESVLYSELIKRGQQH